MTCLADQFGVQAAESSVRLLRRFGCEVVFPAAQTCCGQPAHNAGYAREARTVARHFLEVFGEAEVIVAPSGSCTAMVHAYPELFRDDPVLHEQARRVAGRTHELTQFLVDVLGVRHAGTDLSGLRVAYHDSCHALRHLGVHAQPRALLSAAGAQVLAWDESCCGFGGLFSVKLPELSQAMMNRKLSSLAVDAIGADVLCSTDLGCLMQLGGGLSRAHWGPPALHVAQLLEQGPEALAAGRTKGGRV
ncbi:(Fe-S)-binding protein [Deinococcus peraridilitoris]|uniref:(Fe-S)-binding protein n=1 Tax=Deinococcus peraridilitoris TaxID=432329 RepID=UPI001C2558F3|nr:(Fe-S)-binding protein [Deinococcus peraridilitoris]